jgi:hypothetical protein
MNHKGFIGMIGLMLTAAIIGFLACITFKQYFNKPADKLDPSTQKAIQDSGIDTSSQLGILESAKSTIKQANQTELKRSEETMNSLMNR